MVSDNVMQKLIDIDISKTHTETNTEKIFNTDTIYI